MPSVEATTWYLVPALPRSVGLGPVSSPPRLARTEQLSTTTSHEVASGPARTIRTRVAWTQRSRAVALQSSSRRRKVEPEARPTIARSSRHCTPSRTKNRNASTTLIVGMGGRPVPSGRFSIWSMIPATNAAALDPMSASRCQRYGKQPRTQPDAAGSTTAPPGFWKLPLSLGAVTVELAVEGLRLEDQGRADRGGEGAVLVHPARDVGVGQQVYLLPGLEERAGGRAVALRHAAVGDQEVERRRQLGRLVEVVDDTDGEAALMRGFGQPAVEGELLL